MNLPSAWLFAKPSPVPQAVPSRRNTSIGGLSFALEVDGQHVAMRISEQALRRHFGAQRCRSTWLAAYRRHAAVIDACALAEHRRQPTQPVFLQSTHFVDQAALSPAVN